MIEQLWLALLAGGLAVWTVRGARQYADFKKLSETPARCGFYWRWTWEPFVGLTGASVVTLLMLGQADAPFILPEAFRALAAQVESVHVFASSRNLMGFAMGAAAGGAALAILQARKRKALPATVGDIEALMPRNGRERWAVLPLCLNAGFSEELFFRVALPLLITHLTGSAVIGFVAAGAVFGLMHVYQGWKGVLATTAAGAVLTVVYLGGGLLHVMVIHALIDVVALLVRPTIGAWIARGRGPAAA